MSRFVSNSNNTTVLRRSNLGTRTKLKKSLLGFAARRFFLRQLELFPKRHANRPYVAVGVFENYIAPAMRKIRCWLEHRCPCGFRSLL